MLYSWYQTIDSHVLQVPKSPTNTGIQIGCRHRMVHTIFFDENFITDGQGVGMVITASTPGEIGLFADRGRPINRYR
jgi:hypothetical protein